MRLLLIEEDEGVVDAVMKALAERGHDVETAADGARIAQRRHRSTNVQNDALGELHLIRREIVAEAEFER